MLIEIAQIDIKLGDKKENLEKAIDIIKNSSSKIILFPELFTTGFDFTHMGNLAETSDGGTVKILSENCGEKIVAGSIVEKNRDKIYNSFLLITKKGLIGKYRKIHLFDKEKEYFTAGNKMGVFKTKLGRIGLAICYDLRFSELFREFVKKNVEIVLLCANFPKPREIHWETLVKARAIENQYFMIASNRIGSDSTNEYFGRSMIVDPWGSVLAIANDKEEILMAEIDIEKVKEIRKNFPVLQDIKERIP